MNKLIISGVIALLSLNCSSPLKSEKEPAAPSKRNYVITHYNITFAPDLSNRVNPNLYRRPLNDVQILNIIAGDLYPQILRTHRSENQKDKLLVDFVNKGLITEYAVHTDKLFIDFGRFPNQIERISYILNKVPAKPTLKQDIGKMSAEFTRINQAAGSKNFGADIWTYFNQGIDDKRVLPAEAPRKDEELTVVNIYRNVLVLTTDGYIEAGIFGKGFDLSQKTINGFRKAFLASGENDIKVFFRKNKSFRIRPVNNENLKNLEVLVMELYDRSMSKGGSATVQPTDMEIMKLFWTDWLEQSRVKRFELHPYANSAGEAEQIILNFLGVSKIQS